MCPCYNTTTKTLWDGKLTIWPVGCCKGAKQGSQNHEHSALVWRNKSITHYVYGDLSKTKLIPTIIEKWPQVKELHDTFTFNKMGLRHTFMTPKLPAISLWDFVTKNIISILLDQRE